MEWFEYKIIDMFLIFCTFFGLFCVLGLFLIGFIRGVVFVWNGCTKRSVKWCGGPHTWAVVTGSTDGIGLEYARQLAEKGYNLLLLSRNQEKLNRVRDELKLRHPESDVRVLAVDFKRTDIWTAIDTELKQLEEIHVLVNNVGIVYPNERPEYFTRIPNLNEFILDIINVNIIACTRLTALVLPGMEARGRGVIINISSASALVPIPLLSLYSATKVYMDYLSRALNKEYKPKGIIIQSVLPFYVSTNMSYNMETSLLVPTPKKYVSGALKTVGKVDRTSGYPIHRFLNFLYFWSSFWSKVLGFDINVNYATFRLKVIRKRIYNKVQKNDPLVSEERITLET